MDNIHLSIITPSYNQAQYIRENLESVLSQSRPDIEHIVIDGGSDDGTIDILKKYEDIYNLRWVSEPDRGQTHALNKGLELAEGDWVGWQNSDDFYLPSSFSTFRSALKSHPHADAIYGDLIIVNKNGIPISRTFTTAPSKFVQRYWSLFASNQSLFIKRSVLEEIFPLNEELDYTMDAELTWELLTGNYDLVQVSEPLGAFRVQSEAKTYGNVDHLQDQELESIYGRMWYENYVPQTTLENLAKITKFTLLLRDRNIKALKYNLCKRVPNIRCSVPDDFQSF